MTSSQPPEGPPVRRSRRAVRQAGTVGGDDANLVSTHPAPPADPSHGAARRDPAVVPGRTASGRAAGDPVVSTAEPAVGMRSADDSDVGWGERQAGSNDDRLHEDKPPHW